MKKLLAIIGAIVASAAIAYAAPVPSVPAGPPIEPALVISTLNTLIQQLNGAAGYAPAQIISLGSTGNASGATPVTLNSQRGIVSFTGVGTLVTGAVTTLVMNNSLIVAGQQCFTQVQSGGAAGSAPFVATALPGAGTLTMVLANAGTTATGASQTFAIVFNCL